MGSREAPRIVSIFESLKVLVRSGSYLLSIYQFNYNALKRKSGAGLISRHEGMHHPSKTCPPLTPGVVWRVSRPVRERAPACTAVKARGVLSTLTEMTVRHTTARVRTAAGEDVA
jgi:hypothetical protein